MSLETYQALQVSDVTSSYQASIHKARSGTVAYIYIYIYIFDLLFLLFIVSINRKDNDIVFSRQKPEAKLKSLETYSDIARVISSYQVFTTVSEVFLEL